MKRPLTLDVFSLVASLAIVSLGCSRDDALAAAPTPVPPKGALEALANGAKNKVEIVASSADAAHRDATLKAIGAEDDATLGALVSESGGIVIGDGAIRVFGAGSARVPQDLATWNGLGAGGTRRLAGALVIGCDAFSGFYVVNRGAFAGAKGHVFYLSPVTLGWDDVAPSLAAWLADVFSADLDARFASMSWSGWRAEASRLDGEKSAISVMPPLWSQESKPTGNTTRRPVPIDELWTFAIGIRGAFGLSPTAIAGPPAGLDMTLGMVPKGGDPSAPKQGMTLHANGPTTH